MDPTGIIIVVWMIIVICILFKYVIGENSIARKRREHEEILRERSKQARQRTQDSYNEEIHREINRMINNLLREFEKNSKYTNAKSRANSNNKAKKPSPPSSSYGESHFETLGLSISASKDEVKKAYRKLSFKHHPDKGGNTESFTKITIAKKECLSIISNR